MSKIKRSFHIEWIKLKASYLLLLHVMIPTIGVLGTLAYLAMYRPDIESAMRLMYYSQLLCIAFPLIIGLVTSIAIKQEEETKCYYILGSINTPTYQIMTKCIYFICLSFISISLAIGGMIVGDYMIYGEALLGINTYITLTFILLLTNSILYFCHVFLALRFNTTVSLTISIFGSLLAGVLETGLGEGIWSYVPYAWGLRLSGYFLLGKMQRSFLLNKLIKEQDVLVILSIYSLTVLGIWVWSRRWEGKKAFE